MLPAHLKPSESTLDTTRPSYKGKWAILALETLEHDSWDVSPISGADALLLRLLDLVSKIQAISVGALRLDAIQMQLYTMPSDFRQLL